LRYLVLSDVHSNLEALHSCIGDAEMHGFDRVLCLGDIVGYNANPNECIELLVEKKAICIAGNHDAACVKRLNPERFNPTARKCIEWTKEQLTDKNRKFLSELPVFFSCQFLLAVHGTPSRPLEEYMDETNAKETLQRVAEDLVLCGHTHVPFKVEERGELKRIEGNATIKMAKRMVVSMPSVGQPRDGNPKAGYAILDFGKKIMEVYRVEYNVEKALEKVIAAGLPEFIAGRLKKGV